MSQQVSQEDTEQTKPSFLSPATTAFHVAGMTLSTSLQVINRFTAQSYGENLDNTVEKTRDTIII